MTTMIAVRAAKMILNEEQQEVEKLYLNTDKFESIAPLGDSGQRCRLTTSFAVYAVYEDASALARRVNRAATDPESAFTLPKR